jgi:hypothetical protein
MNLFCDPKLESLLGRLHGASEAQTDATRSYFRRRAEEGRVRYDSMDASDHAHFADKLVALDRDKAEFCYGLCRAIGARRIVELGASFGSRPSIWPPPFATIAARAAKASSLARNTSRRRPRRRVRTSPRPGSPTTSTCAKAIRAKR